ncbi:helix-turn-helix domain-containing protein [Pseudarcicella hirudinis]|uniref:helix-turn-helix domain-containing protein n=1 Tax=Pseudarcicella hirudinis TaxID=1079859 RepID=UPI0035EABE3A
MAVRIPPRNGLGLADQLSTRPQQSKLDFPVHLAEGFVSCFEFEKDFFVRIWQFKANQKLVFNSKSFLDQEDFFTITFTTLANTQKHSPFHPPPQDKEEFQFFVENRGSKNINMLLWKGAVSHSKTFEQGDSAVILTILMNKHWLLNNGLIDNSNPKDSLLKLLIDSNPINVNYQPSLQMVDLFEKILNTHTTVSSGRLMLRGRIYEFLAQIFSQLSERNILPKVDKVNASDLQHLVRIEHSMHHDFSKIMTIKGLSIGAGMSESKFKKIFKQVFGKNVHEHYNDCRLEVAKDLIVSGKMTVSEAGNYVGFANLSNFSSAFKKKYGKLPSKI